MTNYAPEDTVFHHVKPIQNSVDDFRPTFWWITVHCAKIWNDSFKEDIPFSLRELLVTILCLANGTGSIYLDQMLHSFEFWKPGNQQWNGPTDANFFVVIHHSSKHFPSTAMIFRNLWRTVRWWFWTACLSVIWTRSSVRWRSAGDFFSCDVSIFFVFLRFF